MFHNGRHGAWRLGNSGRQPHPAAQKKPNALNLYYMRGNVWEWLFCHSEDGISPTKVLSKSILFVDTIVQAVKCRTGCQRKQATVKYYR